MTRSTMPSELTPDQAAELDRVCAALVEAARDDIRVLAAQIVTRSDDTVFGENEFTLRDIIQRVAAKGLEIALEGRKKGGTKGRVETATAAGSRPVSNAGRRKRS